MSKSKNEYLLHLVTSTMLPVNFSYALCDLSAKHDERPKLAQSTLEVLYLIPKTKLQNKAENKK